MDLPAENLGVYGPIFDIKAHIPGLADKIWLFPCRVATPPWKTLNIKMEYFQKLQ